MSQDLRQGDPGASKIFADILGIGSARPRTAPPVRRLSFSCILFSDVRKDVTTAQKYAFARDIALFADREGCVAVYIPERHFSEFGAIYPNPALLAAYLIPQTQRVRFRTAAVVLPLHHPVEVVEWWAMNDVLSGGRVDLGFASGWSNNDFVLSPDTFEDRRRLLYERARQVQQLWRGESVSFPGPGGQVRPVVVYPRPQQAELNVWILAAQSEESFRQAGAEGHNVFTMLAATDLDGLANKVASYRRGRAEAGLPADGGTVSLMMHTLVHPNASQVRSAVERPFRAYIASSMESHLREKLVGAKQTAPLDEVEKRKMLDYAFERYYTTAALFGDRARAAEMIEHARRVGVDEIAFLMDFGADYDFVRESLVHVSRLVSDYA